ncbi:MAG: hypothetical protein ACTHM9_14155 [Gemmatimonadales bacterium]
MPPTPFRTLLAGAIDYAGLFPPAALGMDAAVREYAEQRAGADAWALGRFVVPAARLEELEIAARAVVPAPSRDAWALSVLLGTDPSADVKAIEHFNRRQGTGPLRGSLVADSVEARADSVASIERLMDAAPVGVETYIEIPLATDPAPLVAAIARGGGRAKARTGGVTAEAFPPGTDIVRFLRACIASGVPFKATAGLHHPLRGEYRLTYAPGSATGTMYGYLNLFLAAAFLGCGMADADALRLLEERDPAAFRVGPREIAWRGHRLDGAALEAARDRTVVSFGSCSFSEPVGEARALGWL